MRKHRTVAQASTIHNHNQVKEKTVNSNNRMLAISSLTLSALAVVGVFALMWLAAPRGVSPAAAQSAEDTPTAIPTATQQASSDKPSTITVRGSGIVTARPDTLVMNVGVVAQENTVKAAQDKASAVMDAIAAKLKAAGIEEKDYRTVQYSVDPVMDFGDGSKGPQPTPRISGFRVSNMLEITFHDPSAAPALLDSLVEAGANTIYNSGYTFSNPADLYKQAYDKAVADAGVRAERLAGLSNLKLGRIVSITEGSANVPGPVYPTDMAKGGAGAGPVFPGQQSVQADLIVTYEAR